jgi:hypothetical protein
VGLGAAPVGFWQKAVSRAMRRNASYEEVNAKAGCTLPPL